jgi:plasmid maintenance system antidote protein VapI
MNPVLIVTGNEFISEIKAGIPEIIELLGDKNEIIRETAAKLIRRFGTEGE